MLRIDARRVKPSSKAKLTERLRSQATREPEPLLMKRMEHQ